MDGQSRVPQREQFAKSAGKRRPQQYKGSKKHKAEVPANGDAKATSSSKHVAVRAQAQTQSSGPAIDSSLSLTAFADMAGLLPGVRKALANDFGYVNASAIQEQAIPKALTNKDLVAQARTGTGKTIAFLIPAMQKESKMRAGQGGIGVLILAPTRELAQQIEKEAVILGKYLDVTTTCVMGGTNIKADKRCLSAGIGVLVATPGRLIDHINNTPGFAGKLRKVHTVILDECDRCVDRRSFCLIPFPDLFHHIYRVLS